MTLEAAMKRIALMLVPVIVAFVTIAAAVIPPAQVHKIFATDLNGGGNMVVEGAVPHARALSMAGVRGCKNSPPRNRDTAASVALLISPRNSDDCHFCASQG
jgi:hypothetical protein